MSFLDVHRVTPLLGEPGLSLRPDRFTLVSEVDGHTALATIERGSLHAPMLWKVATPSSSGSLPQVSRIVEGWAEAMSAAVELAAMTREHLGLSAQAYAIEGRLRDWRSGSLAQSSSSG